MKPHPNPSVCIRLAMERTSNMVSFFYSSGIYYMFTMYQPYKHKY